MFACKHGTSEPISNSESAPCSLFDHDWIIIGDIGRAVLQNILFTRVDSC